VAARGRTLDLKFPKQRHLHHLHHLQPLAATCSHLQELAASKWLLGQVAASGRKWPHVGFEISKAAPLASFASFAATCSHLQELAASKWLLGQVAASGCLDGKYQPEWPHP